MVAICDDDTEILREQQDKLRVAGYTDADAMFSSEQLNFVVVCVPHNAGRHIIEAAAERRIHVLKEKPFATSLTEAKELVDQCERAGIHLMVTLQRRFNTIYTSFIQLADQIGTPFVVDAAHHRPFRRLARASRPRGRRLRDRHGLPPDRLLLSPLTTAQASSRSWKTR